MTSPSAVRTWYGRPVCDDVLATCSTNSRAVVIFARADDHFRRRCADASAPLYSTPLRMKTASEVPRAESIRSILPSSESLGLSSGGGGDGVSACAGAVAAAVRASLLWPRSAIVHACWAVDPTASETIAANADQRRPSGVRAIC